VQSILLTPNRRLAATLRTQYQQAQIKQGALSWQTKPIMPLVSWLESIWFDHTQQLIEPIPLLLAPFQEQLLWEDIIRNSPESQCLLQLSNTAKVAASAWELLKQWKIPLNHPDLTTTEDSQQFLRWAKQFHKRCQQHHWLDPTSIADYLHGKNLDLPHEITLVGFIDIPPQIKALLDHFQTKGLIVSNQPSLNLNQTKFRIPLNDKEDEILTMARWAKATYESKHFNEVKIGCIIPNLDHSRESIQRIFHRVFADYPELIFNISAGKPLSSCPIIYTALQLLNLANDTVASPTFSHILRSPFTGDAEKESQPRALYDRYLQNQNLTAVSLDELSFCPLLAKRIKKIQKIQPKVARSPSQWVDYFNDMLEILGWPGERSLNSEEYQVIQNGWQPLLRNFATLDLLFESLTQKNAVHYLSVLAKTTIFQPQSPPACIQILGLLEAGGLTFDHLWIMGLDDRSWPPLPAPNPFIPHRLQKQLNMPNASAERELIYCQKLTDQLLKHSHTAIFSHSIQEDEMTLRPSALIKHFPLLDREKILSGHFISEAEHLYALRQIESIDDFIGPPLCMDEILQGGTSIFKLQAMCPFKAFSELRLQARFIEPPTGGLRAQDRGKILHKVLELCWLTLKNSEQLHALDFNALDQLITDCIEQTFSQSKATLSRKKLSRYLQIEKKRLQKLLHQWFELEKNRPPFRVIACEEEREVTLGPIHFKRRIDRIDQLENDEKLIIDYKTGKNNFIKAWFGPRPDEPQLPLYCVTEPEPISAIAFAELHPALIDLKGISKEKLNFLAIKSLTESKQGDALVWEDQIAQWREVLINIGQDFCAGNAHIDPKDPIETCRQCHLHPLCRINET
jgi:ATP-dependent helicase/nuclease subunit B